MKVPGHISLHPFNLTAAQPFVLNGQKLGSFREIIIGDSGKPLLSILGIDLDPGAVMPGGVTRLGISEAEAFANELMRRWNAQAST